MIKTGADGLMKYGSNSCVRVRNWSLAIARNSIDVTCINSYDSEYIAGIRSTTGTATLLYDPSQATDRAILNSIFKDNSDCSNQTCKENVSFYLNSCAAGPGNFEGEAILTSVSPSVEVGNAISVQVAFQFTGPLKGEF